MKRKHVFHQCVGQYTIELVIVAIVVHVERSGKIK